MYETAPRQILWLCSPLLFPCLANATVWQETLFQALRLVK